MLTSSSVRWLVTVSMAVLLQLCCCKLEQVVGVLGGLVSHQVRAGGSCCAGEPSSIDDEDEHQDSDDGPPVAGSFPRGEHHHEMPHGPCKCSCDSQLSYADNTRIPDFAWMTWAAMPVTPSPLTLAPMARPQTMRPEVRCRGGPSVSLLILHCTLLV